MSCVVENSRVTLGNYRLGRELGRGGTAIVYEAEHQELGRRVAIKVLSAYWAENPEMRQRFEREAQTIASLNHPSICILHGS